MSTTFFYFFSIDISGNQYYINNMPFPILGIMLILRRVENFPFQIFLGSFFFAQIQDLVNTNNCEGLPVPAGPRSRTSTKKIGSRFPRSRLLPNNLPDLVCAIQVKVSLFVLVAIIARQEMTPSVCTNCIFYQLIKVFN